MRRRKQQFIGLAAFFAVILLFRAVNDGNHLFNRHFPQQETADRFDPLQADPLPTPAASEPISLHDAEPVVVHDAEPVAVSHPNADPGRAQLPHPESSPLVVNASSKRPKATLAIATTILRPGPSFLIWLDYHLQRNTDLVIVFMDDPTERPNIERVIQGRPVVLLEGSKIVPEMSPESRLILRQDDNNNAALAYTLARNLTWLMHIDIDELLYEDGDQTWRDVEGVDEFTFVNHESVPLRHQSDNVFAECHLFKVNSRTLPFMAYANGKSAVRVSPTVQGLGPHEFWGFEGERKTVLDPMILHYANPSFESWVAKYIFYGDFPNYWYGDPEQPNGIEFMLQSRDECRAALESGNWDNARKFYYSMIPNENDTEELIRRGELLRIDPFASPRT
jgi:hypothetical protein